MTRPKPKGLMPNRAARQLLEAIDIDVADSVGQAVRSGIVPQASAELTRTRLHFARVDKWLAMMDRLEKK